MTTRFAAAAAVWLAASACSSGSTAPRAEPEARPSAEPREPETAERTTAEAEAPAPVAAAPVRDEEQPELQASPDRADDAPLRDVPIPPQNAVDRADDPPPRPALGDADERARRLLDAIVANDPQRARDFFFPREAFARVKAIADPDGYWQRLMRFYEDDIAVLHRELALPEGASVEYVGLELSRRGGWVRPREEANALPYHAARHDMLRFRVNGRERAIEIHVLITWGEQWYVTHLRAPR